MSIEPATVRVSASLPEGSESSKFHVVEAMDGRGEGNLEGGEADAMTNDLQPTAVPNLFETDGQSGWAIVPWTPDPLGVGYESGQEDLKKQDLLVQDCMLHRRHGHGLALIAAFGVLSESSSFLCLPAANLECNGGQAQRNQPLRVRGQGLQAGHVVIPRKLQLPRRWGESREGNLRGQGAASLQFDGVLTRRGHTVSNFDKASGCPHRRYLAQLNPMFDRRVRH